MTEVWQNPNKKNTEKTKNTESLGRQLTRGPRNLGAGINKALHGIVNTPSNIAGMLGQEKASNALSFNKGFDIDKFWGLPEELDWSDHLVQAIPEIAGAMALPAGELGALGRHIEKIPKAGKYIERILSEALPQAAYSGITAPFGYKGEAAVTAGATQAPFSALAQWAESPVPKIQKLVSGLLGTAGGALGYYGLNQLGAPGYVSTPAGVGLALLGGKAAGTKGMMMQELAHGKNPHIAQERLKAAENIGLDFLTPSEAYNSPFLGRKQGQLGRTEEGSELMYEKFQQRAESEANAINKVLKEIHDPEVMGPLAEKLYKESYTYHLPEQTIVDLIQNPIIEHALNDVLKKPAYQHKLKGVEPTSFEYWDLVKRALGDMEEAAGSAEAKIIGNTRKSLVEEMDKISPEYKHARSLEERKFAREGLEKAFDKTNINSGHAFFKALRSKEDFAKLMHNLRDIPEIGRDLSSVRQKLTDMRELFKDFRDVSTVKRVTGLEQVGMKQHRNAFDKLQHAFENMFTGGKFDKEAINFITSKDWDKQLAEINKISDEQKRMAKIIDVFGRGVAQGSTKKEPFLETENYDVY